MANLKTFAQSVLLFVTAQAFTMAGLAQSQPLVVSAGYTSPAVILVPGQIIMLYIEGLNLAGQTFTASSIPLPTTLGGITVFYPLLISISNSVGSATLMGAASA